MRSSAWKSYLTKTERKKVQQLEEHIRAMQKERRAIMFKMIDRARRLLGKGVSMR